MHSQLDDDLPLAEAHHDLWKTYRWMTSGEYAYQGESSAFRRTCLSQAYCRVTLLPASRS